MSKYAIEVRNLSKKYQIYSRPIDRLKEMIYRRPFHQEFWALRDINFTVGRGETIGVLGYNGSGKSTLLQLIAGVLSPTEGEVKVSGRVSALLELGAGFNPTFTGRENVFMSGAVMGISREEMAEKFDAIAEFAGIGDFIDQPVSLYSSGMYVRLAFSTAIHVDPDILIVDEALAVGDAVFQHRCMRRIRQLQESGVTIFFVSHDTSAVKSLCTRALLIEQGQLIEEGSPETVANHYLAKVSSAEASGQNYQAEELLGAEPANDGQVNNTDTFWVDPSFDERAQIFRHGTGEARIRSLQILDRQGTPQTVLPFGEEATLRVSIEYLAPQASSILGVVIRDRTGTDIFNTNTREEAQPIGSRQSGDRIVVDFTQRLLLKPGSYSVSSAIAYDHEHAVFLDWVDNIATFQILPPPDGRLIHGAVDLQPVVSIMSRVDHTPTIH